MVLSLLVALAIAGAMAGAAAPIAFLGPTTTITAFPPNPSNTPNPSFSFSSSDPNSIFQCSLDGAPFSSCTSGQSYPGLTDGPHTFQVEATDPAGNTGAPTTPAYSWTIDTAPPTASISSGPPSPTNSTSASFTFSASENGSTFQCSLDSGAYGPCTSGQSYPGLTDGPHTFQVEATDPAGNTGAPTTPAYSWTIDTAPPTASISSGPPSPTNSTSASFTFSASENGSTFQCSLDSAAFSSCMSPQSYPGLTDGPHTFQVEATDPAGNTGAPTTPAYSWTIDTAPPTASITKHPADPSSDKNPSFAFSSTKPSSTFTCSLDSAAFSSCTSPQSYPGLTDGPHTFQVEATDSLGNVGTAAAYSWTIDTAPPTTTFSTTPASLTNSRAASFAFGSTKSGSSFNCSLDGAALSSCTSPQGYSTLSDGLHNFQVKATDSLGNVGPAAGYSWTIDTVPPTLTLPPNLTVGATAADGANVSYPAALAQDPDQSPSLSLAAPQCSPVSGAHFSIGVTAVTCSVMDAAGNLGSDSFTVTVTDTTPPVLGAPPADLTREASGPSGAVATYTVPTAVDAVDGPVPVQCSPGPGKTFQVGVTTVTCTATDSRGNTSTVSFHVTVRDTTPPVLTVPADITLVAGDPASNAAITTFLNAPVASDLVDGAVPVTSDAPSLFPIGTTTVTFVAKDRAGNTASGTARVTVISAGPTPPPPQPPPPDRKPPADVTNLIGKPGSRLVRLSWTAPSTDFGHVVVSRATAADPSTSAVVYTGQASSVVDGGVTNGVDYRYTVVVYDAAGNRSTGAVVVVTPTLVLLLSPLDGAKIRRPPTLVWRAVPGATYYNVQLYRGDQKILSAWPNRARLKLTATWRYSGQRYRLQPGTYQWDVWPGFGPRVAVKYGARLGSQGFVISG